VADDHQTLSRLADGELSELLRLVRNSDIEELELEVAGARLYLKRNPAPVTAEPLAFEDAPTASASGPDFVVSERVGFFHYPDGHRLNVGDEVADGQVLGAIDSLNVPTPVQAKCTGRIDEALVDEGQPVEFGQPLFVIQPEPEHS
jgi:biotin carboxyl carrier protein